MNNRITFRNYTREQGFTKDYYDVVNFMKSLGCNDVHSLNLSWVRWEWCRNSIWFDREHDYLTGIWEEDGQIVGIACYETTPGDGFLSLKPGYEWLLEEMFEYAANSFQKEGIVKIAIPDRERRLQLIAQARGFIATNDRETDSMLDVSLTDLNYKLPEGFSLVSLDDRYDLEQYASVLWFGFNHGKEGPVPLSHDDLRERERSLKGPHNDMSLKIAVANKEGQFVSYAGFWYDESQDFCTLEPCATHPDYRLMGLGKAAVYEGIKRCARRGAKRCVVGSNQDFYFHLGFAPYDMLTYWVRK